MFVQSDIDHWLLAPSPRDLNLYHAFDGYGPGKDQN